MGALSSRLDMDLAILLLPTLKSLQTARVSVHLSANPDLPRARSECFLCSYGQFSATYFSTGLFCQRIINSHLPSFSFTTLRPCVARAVRQESRALRKMLQGPRLRTILLSSLVISCHLLQFSNLPIQLVKIATGWPSMLLGSFHPKRLVFPTRPRASQVDSTGRSHFFPHCRGHFGGSE